MLSLRTRIFIVISLIVLTVLGISVLVSVLSKRKPVAPAVDNQASQPANLPAGTVLYNGAPVVVAPIEQGFIPRPPTSLETEQNGVRQIARIFIERYNSYSTDADYQNIREVRDLVTDDLWTQISVPLKRGSAVSGFVGVTTNVIGAELSDWQGDTAIVILKTAVAEEKNGVEIFSQRAVNVNLTKSGEKWLVNKFVWEK